MPDLPVPEMSIRPTLDTTISSRAVDAAAADQLVRAVNADAGLPVETLLRPAVLCDRLVVRRAIHQ